MRNSRSTSINIASSAVSYQLVVGVFVSVWSLLENWFLFLRRQQMKYDVIPYFDTFNTTMHSI